MWRLVWQSGLKRASGLEISRNSVTLKVGYEVWEDPGGLLRNMVVFSKLPKWYENRAVDLGYRFSSSKTFKMEGGHAS